ncbi:hypothetical protein YC2023_108875 [Brassica napus]
MPLGRDTAMETDTAMEINNDADTNTVAETDTAVPTTDKFVEQPPAIKSTKYIEEWGDGLSLCKHDEFSSNSVIQEIVDRAAYSECYHYLTSKSDRRQDIT